MLKRSRKCGFTTGILLASGLAIANVPHTFENGTLADAEQMNQNFRAQDSEINNLDKRVSALEDSQETSNCTYEAISGAWFVPLNLDFPFNAGYVILSLDSTDRITGTVYPENSSSFSASGSYSFQSDCLIPRLVINGAGITLQMKGAASVQSTVMVGNGYASDGTQLEFNAVKIR